MQSLGIGPKFELRRLRPEDVRKGELTRRTFGHENFLVGRLRSICDTRFYKDTCARMTFDISGLEIRPEESRKM